MQAADVFTGYDDICRCIAFAADTEAICEADGLRELAMAIAAPAVSRLSQGTDADALRTLARSLIGTKAEIFEFRVEQDTLTIELASRILDVTGFPLQFKHGDDVVQIICTAVN